MLPRPPLTRAAGRSSRAARAGGAGSRPRPVGPQARRGRAGRRRAPAEMPTGRRRRSCGPRPRVVAEHTLRSRGEPISQGTPAARHAAIGYRQRPARASGLGQGRVRLVVGPRCRCRAASSLLHGGGPGSRAAAARRRASPSQTSSDTVRASTEPSGSFQDPFGSTSIRPSPGNRQEPLGAGTVGPGFGVDPVRHDTRRGRLVARRGEQAGPAQGPGKVATRSWRSRPGWGPGDRSGSCARARPGRAPLRCLRRRRRAGGPCRPADRAR